MKRIQLAITVLLLSLSVAGQELQSTKFQNKNSIQLELVGMGGLYSLNYERIILNSDFWKLSTQVGFSYYPPKTEMESYWIPISVNGLGTKGNGKNHLDFGLGVVFHNYAFYRGVGNNCYPIELEKYWEWDALYSIRFGYRFQKPKGRFIFRAQIMPMVWMDLSDFFIWGGLSGGYAF